MTTKVMLMLADGAHAVNGRIYVLGGVIRTIMSGTPYSVVAVVEVAYLDATAAHTYGVALFDDEDNVVMVHDDRGNEVRFEFTLPPIDTGIPAGHRPGLPLDVILAFQPPPIPLDPGVYEWKASVDGDTLDDSRLSFSVIAPPPQALAA